MGNDASFSEEMGNELANSFVLGQHFHLPKAGHLLIAEDHQVVNRAIADFIDRINFITI